MLQTCGFGKLFHSKILSSCVTQVDELKEVILLLYIQGISTRKIKKDRQAIRAEMIESSECSKDNEQIGRRVQ